MLLDLLFPKTSLGGESGVWMTPAEWRELDAWPERMPGSLLHCRFLDSVAAADRYGRSLTLRTALRRLKYRRVRAYIGPLSLLLERAFALLPRTGATVLCPVPLHWTRAFLRGFNQSQLLAEALSAKTGASQLPLLMRVRATGFQSHRAPAKRRQAMQAAFVAETRDVSVPRHVVLIDDICTTGATLDACARALKQGGVQRVDAAVVALG